MTETSESMIDLLFASSPNSIRRVSCEEVALSDHGLIFVVLASSVQKERQCFRDVRCWKSCDIDALMEELESAPWSVMDSFEDVDDRWEYWKSMFGQIVDTHIPMKKARVRAQSLPWIGRSVRKLMRARNYYCTKSKKSRNQDDWKQYRKLRNLVTWELKKAKTQFFERMSDHSLRNPRKMWKELNRVLGRGDKWKIDAVKTPDGRITHCAPRATLLAFT